MPHRARLLLLSLAGTFAVTRALLTLSPDTDFDVGAYTVHHLFTGLLLVAVCGIPLVLDGARSRRTDLLTLGFGAGLSLALDEWVYLIVTDGSNASYLLPVSFWGGVVMVGAACAYVLLLGSGGRRGGGPDGGGGK